MVDHVELKQAAEDAKTAVGLLLKSAHEAIDAIVAKAAPVEPASQVPTTPPTD